ncbi:uncharacterized protein TNCV_371771 [Trichonephila clavipes]|nr:uncharacterized protein TNCV_371771 [Trichonephila clavipes]
MISIIHFYLSNARTWLLDHLTPSLPASTDDVVIRVLIESSALKQVVAIHSSMATERADPVSSQASGGILENQSPMVRRSGRQPRLFPGASGLEPQLPEFPMAFQGSWSFGSRHARAIDDGHRNFETRSDDEDDIRVRTHPSELSELPYHLIMRTLSPDRFNVNQLLYIVGPMSFEDTIMRPE